VDAIWALAGAVVGGVAVWFLMRGKGAPDHTRAEELQKRVEELLSEKSKAESEAASRGERLHQLEDELAETESDLVGIQARFHELDVKHAALVSDIDAREQAFEDRIREMKNLEEKFKETFANLSHEAVKKGGEELLKRYQEANENDAKDKRKEIENLLQPVAHELKRLEEFSKELELERLKESTTLKSQLDNLTSGTSKLITALHGSGSAGKWGEVHLQRVVEMAGMKEKTDYVMQEALLGSEGSLRPDMQVFLPGGRTMIIDSKVPIQDLDELEGADADARKVLSQGIANKIYDYAKGLNKRDYSKLEAAPDFVVMFIASESAFRMAVEGRHGLLEDVMNMNVVLVSPSTLLPMLKAVNYGWRQERLAREARNIQQWGKDLYDALVTMKTHYDELGRRIDSVGKSYNKFGGSLDATVIPKARKMKEAGLPSNSEIEETSVVEFAERELRARDFAALPDANQLSLE